MQAAKKISLLPAQVSKCICSRIFCHLTSFNLYGMVMVFLASRNLLQARVTPLFPRTFHVSRELEAHRALLTHPGCFLVSRSV